MVDKQRRAMGYLLSAPRNAPLGYNRLSMGFHDYQTMDFLERLTGEQADRLWIPSDHRQLLDVFARQLDENKPIIVRTGSTRNGVELPSGVHPSHSYEVVRVAGDKIELWNPWGSRYEQPEPISAQRFQDVFTWSYVTLV